MCDFEKKCDDLGKKSAIFNKIGKVYLFNWNFSANWECSRSIGNFFSQLGKKFGTRGLRYPWAAWPPGGILAPALGILTPGAKINRLGYLGPRGSSCPRVSWPPPEID